jgi:cytochrome c6
MKTVLSAVGLLAVASFLAFSGCAPDVKKGEALFKQHCSMCHPDGGNIINAQKTLSAKDRSSNKIEKPEDIVRLMRNPGPGMTTFDEKTIPDKEAMEIARYIQATFK